MSMKLTFENFHQAQQQRDRRALLANSRGFVMCMRWGVGCWREKTLCGNIDRVNRRRGQKRYSRSATCKIFVAWLYTTSFNMSQQVHVYQKKTRASQKAVYLAFCNWKSHSTSAAVFENVGRRGARVCLSLRLRRHLLEWSQQVASSYAFASRTRFFSRQQNYGLKTAYLTSWRYISKTTSSLAKRCIQMCTVRTVRTAHKYLSSMFLGWRELSYTEVKYADLIAMEDSNAEIQDELSKQVASLRTKNKEGDAMAEKMDLLLHNKEDALHKLSLQLTSHLSSLSVAEEECKSQRESVLSAEDRHAALQEMLDSQEQHSDSLEKDKEKLLEELTDVKSELSETVEVCACACACACIRVWMRACVFVCGACVCVRACVRVCVYCVRVCVCVCICVRVWECVWECVCVCWRVYVYVYVPKP